MSDDEVSLRIVGVDQGDEIAGARQLKLRTTRGEIPIIVHAAETAGGAMLCISGAIGGFDGPAKLRAARVGSAAARNHAGAVQPPGAQRVRKCVPFAPRRSKFHRPELRHVDESHAPRATGRVDPRLIRNLLELGGSLWLVLLC